MRRVAAKLQRPDFYMTGGELLVWWSANLVALVLGLVVAPWLLVLAAPAWPIPLYRSTRRRRAARRAGLDGFVEQRARVGDEERERKVAALRRELGEWPPGVRWLEEVDARAADR